MQRSTRLPRRPTDHVEDLGAWVLGVLGCFLLLVAVLTGSAADQQVSEQGRAESAVSISVTAVLIEDAPLIVGGYDNPGPMTSAAARWIAPDGRECTGQVMVGAGRRAGSAVTIWVDRAGAVVDKPATAAGALLTGVSVALGLALADLCVVVIAWMVLRRLTTARNLRRWEREWERVGPGWTAGRH